jgi:hypothetical protein
VTFFFLGALSGEREKNKTFVTGDDTIDFKRLARVFGGG